VTGQRITGADLLPFARIVWSADQAPGAAAPWLLPERGGVRLVIPVSAEVAGAIGMTPDGAGGYRPMRRKATNLPGRLQPLAVLAMTDQVMRPEDHPNPVAIVVRDERPETAGIRTQLHEAGRAAFEAAAHADDPARVDELVAQALAELGQVQAARADAGRAARRAAAAADADRRRPTLQEAYAAALALMDEHEAATGELVGYSLDAYRYTGRPGLGIQASFSDVAIDLGGMTGDLGRDDYTWMLGGLRSLAGWLGIEPTFEDHPIGPIGVVEVVRDGVKIHISTGIMRIATEDARRVLTQPGPGAPLLEPPAEQTASRPSLAAAYRTALALVDELETAIGEPFGCKLDAWRCAGELISSSMVGDVRLVLKGSLTSDKRERGVVKLADLRAIASILGVEPRVRSHSEREAYATVSIVRDGVRIGIETGNVELSIEGTRAALGLDKPVAAASSAQDAAMCVRCRRRPGSMRGAFNRIACVACVNACHEGGADHQCAICCTTGAYSDEALAPLAEAERTRA